MQVFEKRWQNKPMSGADRVAAASPITAETGDHDGIRYGFFTREGGVSEGAYASLNCGLGSGDDPERVLENRARATARLAAGTTSEMVTARQVHSATVVVVERPWPAAERPQADGLATRTRGLALGILTADCAPVLFADTDAQVIGAAHAGWRGAKAGILEQTIGAMVRLGARAERIVAAIGPCIGRHSYEVGQEFHAAFTSDDADTADLFQPASRPGHFLFDLAGYVGRRLNAIGLQAWSAVGHDTFADGDRYFSYRRSTMAGDRDYGRQISAIMLER